MACSEAGLGRGKLFETRAAALPAMQRLVGVEESVGALRRDRQVHLHGAEAEARTILATRFFRDPEVFEMLRAQVLPELVARRRRVRRLRVWSAGCSTGQEAYSLAMLLCEEFGELRDWDVRIVGTDISREAVDAARAGHYGVGEVMGELAERLRARYLVREGEDWVVAEQVRGMCRFGQGDLCELERDGAGFDLVLLRNVLLYLGSAERRRVFGEVRRRVAVDGFLVLGSSERAEDSTALFGGESAAGGYVYRPAIVG